jgi:hypothetical protein
MKSSLVLVGLCTFLVTLALPAESRAGIGWLEKLSGPGPFVGIVVPVPIRCDRLKNSYQTERSDAEGAVTYLGCDPNDREEGVRRIIGAEVWRLWTDHNELPNPSDTDEGVRIFAALGTLEFAPWKQVKVGGGFGVAWFSGDTFDTFARPLAQPVRLTVAPLSLLKPDSPWLEVLKIHANANIFLGGVDARDFGSGGTFEAPYELVWMTSIEFDVIPLIAH